ncbi:uncharacterized protein TM35_001391010 [Trypanosoma theileri]|uniref:Mucin TcMUCII n=1 Tax=Trypanosoma theileri TaxID=67003 RepID=A0A1X0NDH8_9TRYP|nr:uncharacterized protein TM35_001391010 [Trypanosoma theileri]ORC80899.1 hypothetical protein TM35_001391010 [Trypanosoma theileri]
MMMMMMDRVMCVLAVVLCCACEYTMMAAAAHTTVNAGQPKAVMANKGPDIPEWNDFLGTAIHDYDCINKTKDTSDSGMNCTNWRNHRNGEKKHSLPDSTKSKDPEEEVEPSLHSDGDVHEDKDLTRADGGSLRPPTSHTTSKGTGSEHNAAESETAVTHTITPGSDEAQLSRNAESTLTAERGASSSTEDNQGASGNTADNTTTNNSTPADSNLTTQTPAIVDSTATPDTQENTSTTLPTSPENTTTEAPTTTPSPVPPHNSEITTIASTVQKNKPIVDSSVSPVWMRTAAPMLIVAVLFSFTVY